MTHPNKVGSVPVDGGDELKRTHEIGMALPVLEPIDLAGKTVTADALLTQRKLATYLVERDAHYLFIAKDHQPPLRADIRRHFAARGAPDCREPPTLQHGRIESRAIRTATALPDDLDFPPAGQVFPIDERHETYWELDPWALTNNRMHARLAEAQGGGTRLLSIVRRLERRVGLFDTEAMPDLVEAGRRATEAALPNILALVQRAPQLAAA